MTVVAFNELGGETIEREIPGVGTLRFENFGPSEWMTKRGDPAQKAKRRYLLDGQELPSVTQIVGVLDKPALIKWAEDMGCRGAVEAERMGELHGLEPEDYVRRVRALGLGADAKRDAAADRGTVMHTALQALATTGEPPNLGDHLPEHRPWLMGATRLWVTLGAEPVDTELIVCHPELGYAGRLDLLCRTDGVLTLLEYKSGKGRIFPQGHWQVRGYADTFPACGLEAPERIYIAGVDDEGGFEIVECDKSTEDFRALVHVYRAGRR